MDLKRVEANQSRTVTQMKAWPEWESFPIDHAPLLEEEPMRHIHGQHRPEHSGSPIAALTRNRVVSPIARATGTCLQCAGRHFRGAISSNWRRGRARVWRRGFKRYVHLVTKFRLSKQAFCDKSTRWDSIYPRRISQLRIVEFQRADGMAG